MAQFLNQNNLEQPQQANLQNAANILPMMMNPMFLNPFLNVPNLADFSPPINSNNLNSNNGSDSTSTTNGLPAENPTENVNQAQNDNQNDVDLQNNGWLDMINIFWNILILLSLLSASYCRTIFVLSIGLFYFFYQSGFFSSVLTRFFGDFAPMPVNNHNPPINEDQLQQMMDNAQIPAMRRRNVASDTPGDNIQENETNTIDNNQPEQHFMINKLRFCWIVISSLFSSLMPHNEPAVPVN